MQSAPGTNTPKKFITSIGRRVLAFAVLLLVIPAQLPAGTFVVDSRKDLAAVEARARAAQFLSRATFGPTKSELDLLAAQVEAVGAETAFEAWIDTQFNLPETYHHPHAKQMIVADGFDYYTPGIRHYSYRNFAWWDTAVTAPDQLRQRMAWALAQIFVINQYGAGFNSVRADNSGEPQYLGIVDYYDMLIGNSFGNYRALLEDVSLHPVMGVFLSSVRNPKGDPSILRFPDENYARELLQLLSIGLYEMRRNSDVKTDRYKNPIPTFDNEDIRTFARVFTGLAYTGAPSFFSGQQNLHEPMTMWEAYHDTDEKELFNGTILPAGQSGLDDIRAALDNLSEHSNIGPHIGRILIQRFVKSNPSTSYINAVAAAYENNGSGVRGDFRAMLKAVLLHREALESQDYRNLNNPPALLVLGGGTEHTRLREPVLRFSALLRAFATSSTHPQGKFMIPDLSSHLNQEVYRSPSIFNFYLPNHIPGGDIQHYKAKGKIPNRTVYAPEFQIFTSVASNRIANRLRADVNDAKLDISFRLPDGTNLSYDILFDFTAEEVAAETDPGQVVGDLNMLLCHGSMSDPATQSLVDIIAAATTNGVTRARGAILAILTSPDCAVAD